MHKIWVEWLVDRFVIWLIVPVYATWPTVLLKTSSYGGKFLSGFLFIIYV